MLHSDLILTYQLVFLFLSTWYVPVDSSSVKNKYIAIVGTLQFQIKSKVKNLQAKNVSVEWYKKEIVNSNELYKFKALIT